MNGLNKYYNSLARWAEEHRWDYFHDRHELCEFVPTSPLDEDFFSLAIDVEEDLAAEFQSRLEPLTYDDCVNYFSGRPLCHGAGYRQARLHGRY